MFEVPGLLSGELDGDQRFGPPRGPKHWTIVVREEVARGKGVPIMLGWGHHTRAGNTA